MADTINAEMIDGVENPLLKQVLRLRFIQKMSVPEIAEEIHFCLRHTFRILNKAIDAVKERSSNNEGSE